MWAEDTSSEPPRGVAVAAAVRWSLVVMSALALGLAVALTRRDPPSVAVPYVCPMHPEVRSQGPSKCPACGMDLTPVLPDSAGLAGDVPGLAGLELGAADRERLRVTT